MSPPAGAVSTPWLFYPDQYTGTCESEGGATWPQVSEVAPTTDKRPFVNEVAGPTWSHHFQDINLVLGNLVTDVQDAEAASNRWCERYQARCAERRPAGAAWAGYRRRGAV
jgi:hypothetical protein